MCGICGKMLFREAGLVNKSLIEKMSTTMNHRGPDDCGVYTSRKIGLGHRRLSIIDLQTGKQPLSNENNTIWIVFNGEIYNYQELRNELLRKGHIFKTQTDTEVIVHLYEEHGENFISKLRGMFAIALWDEISETLILARDRVGIKPLYYFKNQDSITFGSEIKSILADNSVPREVNLSGIKLLLTYNYIPGEETLQSGIKKLLPGHYLKVKNGSCVDKEYWDLTFSEQRKDITIKGAEKELVEILRKAIRDHMISDVPVGFLLSGGVDSTALLSYAVDETDKKISTFTIGFEDQNFADERYYARLASKRFGTEHYDMTISANDFLDFLPKYVWHMEEPVCEPPAVALYYVSKLAKDHVKVLLSGEGGDEAFAGYQTYRNLVWLERIKKAAGPLRHAGGKIVSLFTQTPALKRFNKYGYLMGMDFNEYYFSRSSNPLSFMNKNANTFYDSDVFKPNNNLYGDDKYRRSLFPHIKKLDMLNKMLYIDTKTWLPDDLLVKADKMTMANSIELRVPLLDHVVLEFAASLPSDFKLRGLTTKYILKKACKSRIPDEIINRKKTGFPVPYDQWMSRELNGHITDILLDKRTINRGYFNQKAISGLLDANRQKPAYSKEIFLLVALELWHRCFIDS
jgi:asparagine synthase (glutamine-hydrolysing)